ncbi:dTDP-4-dehydrorhamnose 3,5-epimerase [Candidatus Falkowbacteria bacterium]|uniref:dTDP-4-dehydrorhamnose 3,5-epimerase n=1 Tax=Candidatus Falkowbacteria bacterium CG10_big_fil_rev_8_21_14_0_10_37_18 TaxID=1974562 RepID=A0A2H0V8T8_9BACT|nr:dTDP-4-dehydrorhamnose 3,5-epimerase [Candidatus Falkowbacteria bacterium]NCQ12592.1 dTDP-4-dehydrorhamnose 3,5-epimerase [Candidatus Falkowbacteria bacterium]OIO05580.1 MAG: dTDP-4-dehydrorhamnose 3,5-epimerase [Candidatus Falkowbacteria bacterium CG1_02_37_21]PIR95483.1 MAG: dTDP-4-dehydrorhamnose 3,5-epimerase [Candidatus Falkowbacteria bacterium CG10_big_fil_rev_8_21_14_0_10_37_18]
MIKDVIIKNLTRYNDERGWLTEIFRRDELNFTPAMSYVSMTNPGVVRGPHEHVSQSDCFVFLGPGSFRLYLWDRRDDSSTKGEAMDLEVGENNPSLVIVPPGVVHGYKCISDVAALSINLPDQLYKGEGKSEEIDEIRWEIDPESPYKIN